MKNSIFYSWQSDLANNTNRRFIETCIQKAIQEIENTNPFNIEIAIDRDTKDETGTPDITSTIFSKIDKAKIFIADVSIINKNSNDRKTPNPNVLLELGYAAKVLGWERIICVYNSDFGDVMDLPFDLRFRRPLVYSLKNKDIKKVREKISKIIATTIIELEKKGLINDEINDFIKVPIDTEILTLINHLSKIMFDYTGKKSFGYYRNFMKLDLVEITEKIKERKFLGFQIFKKFEDNGSKIRDLLNNIITSNFQQRELSVILIKLFKWVEAFDKFNSLRTSPNLFIDINETSNKYISIYGPDLNPTNKDGYILLQKIGNKSGRVVDFGEFQEKIKINNQLKFYEINIEYVEEYSIRILEFIKIVQEWLKYTNNTFIIDNNKHFELKQTNPLPLGVEIVKAETIDLWNLFEYVFRINYDRTFSYEKMFYLNFMKLFINFGYIFNNHKEIVKNLENEIVAAIKCNSINSIEDIDVIYKFESNVVLHQKEGLEKLKQAKHGFVIIDKLYIDKHFLEYITVCLSVLNNSCIEEEIKKGLFYVFKINVCNLVDTMQGVLKNCLIDFIKTDNKQGYTINIAKEFNHFLRLRIDVKNEMVTLKDIIKKKLLIKHP